MEISFWKDKSKMQLDIELFSTKAQKLAEEIYKDQKQSKGKVNKPTQIRKFYDEILKFDSIIKSKPDDFEKLLPYLKMLNAKAAYALGRKLVSKKFKDFIFASSAQINTKEDFDAFKNFFEAFMGFYKYYDEKGQ
jgi:CRISPR-associated protein Csm2